MAVFIGSIPNAQEEDVALASSILNGQVNPEGSLGLLKKKFQKDAYLFNKGRDALYFGLNLLNLKEKDEVITQAFTCVAVVAPIMWAKAKPVYVDIDPKTFNMDLGILKEKITENTRAIVVQHTFGNMVDIGRVREIVKKYNEKRDDGRKIYIFEDCAHIFTPKFSQLNIGRYSDAFFFSFSQDKGLSCTQGGAIFFNDESLLKNAKVKYLSVPEQSESMYSARYVVAWDSIKRNYFKKLIPLTRITLGKVLVIMYRLMGYIKKQASVDTLSFDQPKRMSEVQACMLLKQLERVNKFNNKRIDVVKKYNSEIRKNLRFDARNYILVRYPILLANRGVVKKKLRELGIISGVWYSSPVFPLSTEDDFKKVSFNSDDCPKAVACSNNVLNLPTNIEVTNRDLDSILKIVNEYGEATNF